MKAGVTPDITWSKDFTEVLPKGTLVHILEVKTLEETHTVRGRLKRGGWISLKNLQTGMTWVSAAKHRTPAAVAGAAGIVGSAAGAASGVAATSAAAGAFGGVGAAAAAGVPTALPQPPKQVFLPGPYKLTLKAGVTAD